MAYPVLREAAWPLRLPTNLPDSRLQQIKDEVERLANASQYGWGQTIDFGAFQKDGLLRQGYLKIAGAFDDWGWWPSRLDGLRTADIGCFTGGSSLLMAHRGAAVVYAVDEIPEHLAQCAFLVQAFGIETVRPLLRPAYRLREDIEPGSLDIILLSGVLYHMSDMLVGLYAMRELLKPGGLLLIQSSGVDDFEQSYANFGRFIAGRWWQPSGLCIQDMLELMGFRDYQVRFHDPNNCLVRAYTANGDIPFKRGLNWPFESLRDARPRLLDHSLMAPVRTAQRNDTERAPDPPKQPFDPNMSPETAPPEGGTLYDLWANEKIYQAGWDLRAKVAVGLLRREKWICDLGCGMQALRSLIPATAIYLPADLKQWTPDTSVCELNQGLYPTQYLRMCDVCFVLGVIEYIWRPDLLFAILGELVEVVIFSYNVKDLVPANRSKLWVNSFSDAELCSIANAAGFDITDRVGSEDKTQIIVRAQNRRYGYGQRFRRALSRMKYRPI